MAIGGTESSSNRLAGRTGSGTAVRAASPPALPAHQRCETIAQPSAALDGSLEQVPEQFGAHRKMAPGDGGPTQTVRG